VSKSEYLTEDDLATKTSSDDNGIDSDSDDKDENRDLDDLYDKVTSGEIDLDTIMISSTHAGKSTGVDPAHLSKIWKIDLKTAQSEHSMWSPNTARELTTRSYQEITVLTTVCCDTGGSQSTSSWIRSSPPRRLASRLEVTPVASFSLLTRDSFTSFP